MREPIADNSFESVSRAVSSLLSRTEFSSFEIGVSSEDAELKHETREKSINFVEKVFRAENKGENHDVYVLVNLDRGFAELQIRSIFLEGRYNKFSREIAQTFHYCYKCRGRGCAFCSRTGKLTKESVQELLEKETLPAFGAAASKFHGAGREDVDVLMLGKGRPFVLELLSPKKRSAGLKKIEGNLNKKNPGKIFVHGLEFSAKDRVIFIKNTPFQKIYSAKCRCQEGIMEEELSKIPGQRFSVCQSTPERVAKRRAEKNREKHALVTKKNFLGNNCFSLEVLASHGLYVKELVSGDNNRTKPSISSFIGKECLCEELDVLEILTEE